MTLRIGAVFAVRLDAAEGRAPSPSGGVEWE